MYIDNSKLKVSLDDFITLSFAMTMILSLCFFAQSLAFLNAITSTRNLLIVSIITKVLS